MADPFDPHLRAAMLAQLSDLRRAGLSFDRICELPGWPSRPTLRKWLRQGAGPEPPRLRRPPVRWSRRLAPEICERFHVQSLREICASEGMPDRKSLEKWRRKHPWFHARLAAVRREAGQPPTGRRTTWCELIGDDICERLLELGALTRACDDAGLPVPRTVRDWARRHPDFAHGLHLAREMSRERRADHLLPQIRQWEAELRAKREGNAEAPLPPPRSGGRGTARRRAGGGGGKPRHGR